LVSHGFRGGEWRELRICHGMAPITVTGGLFSATSSVLVEVEPAAGYSESCYVRAGLVRGLILQRKKSFVAFVVVILALVGLNSELPSAVAQEQSSCGRAAQDYVGATYVGTSIRATGAVSVKFTFDTVSWVTVRSPEGLSQRQWFFDEHGITVRTPPGSYLLTTRVCDGLGDRMPSMVGGVMEWENMEVYPFTLYRRP